MIGLENRPAFREAIFGGSGALDSAAIEKEVTGAARGLIRQNPGLKAVLLECSSLPPYASAVQKEVHVPVFFNTMIQQVYRAFRLDPYPSVPRAQQFPGNEPIESLRFFPWRDIRGRTRSFAK